MLNTYFFLLSHNSLCSDVDLCIVSLVISLTHSQLAAVRCSFTMLANYQLLGSVCLPWVVRLAQGHFFFLFFF